MTEPRSPGAPGDAPVAGEAPGEQQVPIGRISAAHGVRGWLRVQVYGDGGEALRPGVALLVTPARERARVFELRQVTAGRRGSEVRIALEGVESREAAEALCGAGVSVAASVLGPPGEDEVWAHDLVGCQVVSEEGAALGEILGVWETGAPDVLVVAGANGREHLVPAALLRDVDLAARRVVVEILPGLLEAD